VTTALTVNQLADRMGVHRATVYTLLSQGLAPRAIRVGKRLRFRLHDVEQFERLSEFRPRKARKARKERMVG